MRKGQSVPAEQKERQAAALRGRKDSEETRLKKKAASQARAEEQRQDIKARWAGEWGDRMREMMRSPVYRAFVSQAKVGKKQPWAGKHGGSRFGVRDRSTYETKRVAGITAFNQRPDVREKRRQARLGGPPLCTWTPEMLEKHSKNARALFLAGTIGPKRGTRWAFLDRLGRYWRFRSSYELHAAEALDRLELSWFYEPSRLLLSDGRIYIPDFWIEESKTFLEVKGWKGWHADKVALAQQDGHSVVMVGDLGDITQGDAALLSQLTVANADGCRMIDDITRGDGDLAHLGQEG